MRIFNTMASLVVTLFTLPVFFLEYSIWCICKGTSDVLKQCDTKEDPTHVHSR